MQTGVSPSRTLERGILSAKLIKRRNAVEPVIGHLKADHRMGRCHLRGEIGDRLHAVLCAAGYNLRWPLRAIARKYLGASFWLLPSQLVWAIRKRLAQSFLRISVVRLHEMAPDWSVRIFKGATKSG